MSRPYDKYTDEVLPQGTKEHLELTTYIKELWSRKDDEQAQEKHAAMMQLLGRLHDKKLNDPREKAAFLKAELMKDDYKVLKAHSGFKRVFEETKAMQLLNKYIDSLEGNVSRKTKRTSVTKALSTSSKILLKVGKKKVNTAIRKMSNPAKPGSTPAYQLDVTPIPVRAPETISTVYRELMQEYRKIERNLSVENRLLFAKIKDQCITILDKKITNPQDANDVKKALTELDKLLPRVKNHYAEFDGIDKILDKFKSMGEAKLGDGLRNLPPEPISNAYNEFLKTIDRVESKITIVSANVGAGNNDKILNDTATIKELLGAIREQCKAIHTSCTSENIKIEDVGKAINHLNHLVDIVNDLTKDPQRKELYVGLESLNDSISKLKSLGENKIADAINQNLAQTSTAPTYRG